ncbi:MAG: Stp1/IreP family PP2C-type Ser/Thr phosphatase [Lachnospiraceae bacterium]|nr:Stp1/IreP family PP2C-type Ser/Thr phosphatase [Lachnospiraceae bacterium]
MLTTCSKTDIGRKRVLNQDTVYSCNVPIGNLNNLFIVADGMGGHKAGDYASAYTVNAIEREVELCEDSQPVKIIDNAIKCANKEIFDKAHAEEDFAGMGTTVVVATVEDNILYVGNVGDSRLYVIDDSINQITKDHSLVEEMVRVGEIKREDARLHPDKNIITRAIGADENVVADFFEVELKPKDIVLMCSDGLTNMVEDNDILSIVKSKDNVKDIADELIRVANHNGGKDNIGVVLVQFEGVGK